MNRLARNYDRLTGDERFRLALAAFARGDYAEAITLGTTCPVYAYNMKDWEFSRRMAATDQTLMALALEIEFHIAVIRHLDWQAEYVNACLESLETCGVDAAIQAHWLALDPDGAPENRKRLFPLPDIEHMMRGAVRMPYHLTERLREFWSEVRKRKLQAVATILAGFDAFAKNALGVSGDVAIKACPDVFEDLSPYLEEAREMPVDEAMVNSRIASFTRLWCTYMRQ